jgi:hypothetical protein
MRRELGVAFGARLTWLVAAAGALVVGHSFVLAVDIFAAASRSALSSALQAREMDPLLGIVRPTLGGADLVVAVFGPLVAARVLSVEKERRTLGALCLLQGSSSTVVVKKLVAAYGAAMLLLVGPIVSFLVYALAGGRLDGIETTLAVGSEALHVALVTAVSVAASAWTSTLAQAAAFGVLVSLSSWAIDAADGFAALAWLGSAHAWSIDRRLEPFQHGVLSLGSLVWLVAAIGGAVALALVGARFDVSRSKKGMLTVVAVGLTCSLLAAAGHWRRGYDWSEQRRASLPPSVVAALRSIAQPITVDVHLDRDDSRRRQIETDALAKLTLARPDMVVHAPLDIANPDVAVRRVADYGKIVVHVGNATRETRSTSRREIATLVMEAAGIAPPDWSPAEYSGHPHVVEGSRRSVLAVFAYALLPATFIAIGVHVGRRRSVR